MPAGLLCAGRLVLRLRPDGPSLHPWLSPGREDGVPDPDAREVIHLINVDAPNLAAAVGEAYLVQRPQDARERNAAARQNYVHDTMGQLRFLSEALAMGQ